MMVPRSNLILDSYTRLEYNDNDLIIIRFVIVVVHSS